MRCVSLTCLPAVIGLAALVGCETGERRTELVPEEPRSAWARDEPLWYRQPDLLVPPGNNVSPNQGARLRREQEQVARERRQLQQEKAAFEAEKRATSAPDRGEPTLKSRPTNPNRINSSPRPAPQVSPERVSPRPATPSSRPS